MRVRRRSSAHLARRSTADGAGGSWSVSGRWTSGGLAEPLWRELPRSDGETSSENSSDDADSSVIERVQKEANRIRKAKKREKQRGRRNAAANVQRQPRVRRQSEAAVSKQARMSTRRRSSAPENASRPNPIDSELYATIAESLHLPETGAPEDLIVHASRQLGIPLGDTAELYEPAAMASATEEVLRALGLSAHSKAHTSGRKAGRAKPEASMPAWRVGAVDVLNTQHQAETAREPRRERRRSRGNIQ